MLTREKGVKIRKETRPGNEAPPVVGLTGGIASGKTTVARMLGDLGATVIDADAIARQVLQSPAVRDKIRTHWGAALLDASGRPDRARIADLVFTDPEKLRMLNEWVHPPTLAAIGASLAEARKQHRTPLIVIDAPLLLEAELDTWCDAVVFVEAERSRRSLRAQAERQWSKFELERREARQRRLCEKRRRADFMLENNHSLQALRGKVAKLFHALTRSHRSKESLSHPPGGNHDGQVEVGRP